MFQRLGARHNRCIDAFARLPHDCQLLVCSKIKFSHNIVAGWGISKHELIVPNHVHL